MSRLVVVSNRVAPSRGEALAGGLATAISSVLHDRGGLWFGWSSRVCEQPSLEAAIERSDRMTVARVDLGTADHEGYYNGHANRCLWPLCHFRIDLMAYDAGNAAAYARVNAHLARSLLPLLLHDDLIWVHDYHLVPFAKELRSLGCRQRIGFFLHVPFPPPDLLVTLPGHEDLVHDLLAFDLVGLQTEADVQRLVDYIERQELGPVIDNTVRAIGGHCRLGCFPVGIDTGHFHELAFSPRGDREFQQMRHALRGRDQIISVDRLDYTKGLLRRIGAFETLLTSGNEILGRIEFLQIAPVSRGDLRDYREFRRDLELAASRLNGRFTRADWTPLRYINRTLSRSKLAGLYRASRIGLVTPMRDGMNLVCKEYVAAQDPQDPGVLVLSRFAGAADQMKRALLVNPYDGVEVAESLKRAQSMSLHERRVRYEDLMSGLNKEDSSWWARSFIDALGSTSLQDAAQSSQPAEATL